VSIHVDQWFSQMVNIFAFAADRENCTGCICKSEPGRMFNVCEKNSSSIPRDLPFSIIRIF
jgi:hypothetical protein